MEVQELRGGAKREFTIVARRARELSLVLVRSLTFTHFPSGNGETRRFHSALLLTAHPTPGHLLSADPISSWPAVPQNSLFDTTYLGSRHTMTNQLPTKGHFLASGGIESGECTICMEPYNAKHHSCVQFSHCGHQFCRTCLHTWLDRNNTCPKCQTELFKMEVHAMPVAWPGYSFLDSVWIVMHDILIAGIILAVAFIVVCIAFILLVLLLLCVLSYF